MSATVIYKLATRTEWEAAQAEGVYRGSAHDLRDGFIHFSAAAQLAETARKHFKGMGGLILLAVEVEDLNEPYSPHPVPLPMGEGTPEKGAAPATPFPLPMGQGEGSALRWEPSRGGDLFPHVYAALPISAVKSITPIALAEDGTPIIPAGLAS